MDAADLQDIQASLRGDGQAFERLVRRYQNQVAGRMWRFTRDRQALEELVQEVFVEAYASLRSFRGTAPLAHWLNRIATRVGYRYWKRRKRAAEQAPLQDWDGFRDSDAEAVESSEAAEMLHALMERLRPRDRLVLTLLYLEELPVAEVAQRTGWSKTMVKVQAFRARKKLRKLLEQTGIGRGPDPGEARA